jgi:hypothetical protein
MPRYTWPTLIHRLKGILDTPRVYVDRGGQVWRWRSGTRERQPGWEESGRVSHYLDIDAKLDRVILTLWPDAASEPRP